MTGTETIMRELEQQGFIPNQQVERIIAETVERLEQENARLLALIHILKGGVCDLQRQTKADVDEAPSNIFKWSPLTLGTIGGMHKAIKEAGL